MRMLTLIGLEMVTVSIVVTGAILPSIGFLNKSKDTSPLGLIFKGKG